ncbi:hypothetical protein ATCC90586_004351 [Pythium insidiosum]|nr:hypothetical protein ATCC90586_004351 [Pythium insidiosum]
MDAHFERVLSASKRHGDDGSAPRDSAQPAKRARRADELSGAQIQSILARADAQAIEELDAKALKSMALALDKAIRRNALQRSKYSDAPAKFMESEVALDEELRRWRAVAAQPALYSDLLALEVVPLLLGLCSHENLDVRLDVINLLADLTDLDEDPSALAPTKALVERLVALEFLPLLVRTLADLDAEAQQHAADERAGAGRGEEEEEEANPSATGVFHALQIIENLVDVLPEASVPLCHDTSVFDVLLRMIAPSRTRDAASAISSSTLYASEILSILLQAEQRNRDVFLQQQSSKAASRLDTLLEAVAPFRKRDPRDENEGELLENLWNALCSLLLERRGQDLFRRLEGLELVLRCLRDNTRFVFSGALRVLDHALLLHTKNCVHWVGIGGLKPLFAVFMGKKKAKAKAQTPSASDQKAQRAKAVENVTSALASLCLTLQRDAPHDAFERFHAKFLELDMEKMDRLVDLFVQYEGRVRAAAAREEDDDEEADDEDERYLQRLDAGLFVLQRVALVLAHVAAFSRRLRAYVMVKFHERNADVAAIGAVLREQLELLAADDAKRKDSSRDEDVVDESARLTALLRVFEDDEREERGTDEKEAPVQQDDE